MLDYEICQKLKDAGYPQNLFKENQVIITKGGKSAMCPDLSELIEACLVLKPNCPFVLTNEVATQGWEAVMADKFLSVSILEAGDTVNAEGASMEEAVANLYLAIHKKTD